MWTDLAWAVVGRLLVASPRAAFLLLGLAWRSGRAAEPLTAAELHEVLPELPPRALHEAARRSAWVELKLRALGRMRSSLDPAAFAGYLRLRDEAGLAARAAAAAPTILLTWHLGGMRLLGPGLAGLGLRLLIVRSGPPRGFDGVAEVRTGPASNQRAFALGRAFAHLRGGGSVLLAADGGGATVRAPCLGRRLRLSRGAFVLSRLTGAPIVPVVALAAEPGPGIEIRVQPPLDVRVGSRDARLDAALARAAAERLEALVRERPGELRRPLLDRILRARRLAPCAAAVLQAG